MKKVIAIPTHNRPVYFSQSFESILAAEGMANWNIALCAESNPPRGCRANTHRACQRATESGADWVLYLEDDVVIACDALALCDQFIAARPDGILCLRRWHESQDLAQPALVTPANHGLLGNGFLFAAAQWPFLSSWWFRDEPGMGGKMWDWSVSWGLDKTGMQQWRPLINRSRNIGILGTHTSGGTDPNHFGPLYKGEPITQFVFQL